MSGCPDCRRKDEQIEELLSSLRVWRANANRAATILAIFAPPDFPELLDDNMTREFLEATK